MVEAAALFVVNTVAVASVVRRLKRYFANWLSHTDVICPSENTSFPVIPCDVHWYHITDEYAQDPVLFCPIVIE